MKSTTLSAAGSRSRTREILFAVLMLILYVASGFVPEGTAFIWGVLYIAALSAFISGFIVRKGLTRKYGLVWPENWRRFLYFIPLWIIASTNLWGGVVPCFRGAPLVYSVISMVFVGFLEEIIFRGLLFKALLREDRPFPAIIVSSAIFGLFHLINLYNGQSVLVTLVQVVFAMALGIAFTMTFYKSGSLLPAIIAHSLFDIFSYFNDAGQVLSWIALSLVVIISVVYGIWLARLPAGHLYIMRHGITEWNVIKKLQGQSDIPLNEDGRALARKAHDEYAGVHFDVCFCSPLVRAKETAALLLEGRGVPVEYDDRLKEMCFGEYEGIENSFAIPDCPINAFFTDPAHYTAPGAAESMEALFARTGAFLDERVKPQLAAGRDVLIVGHGAMNSSIVCQVRHLPLEQFWANGLEQCKLTELPVVW